MASSLVKLVVEAWDWTLQTSPDPFRGSDLAEMLGVCPHRTYRQRLDEQPVNCYGRLIPRIETVRRNLLQLGHLKRRPRIPD